MQLLKELDQVSKEKWVLTCLSKSKSKNKEEDLLTRLYRMVHAGKLSDPEIVADLYGDGTPPSDARYRTLKTRLKEVYLNAFLLGEQEVPSYKTYDEAFRNGHRILSIVRLLIERKAYSAASKVAEQTLKNVKEFEIIPLNQGLTDMLASLYLGVRYDEKKFNLYNELSDYYNKANYDLNLVSNAYRSFRNHLYALRISPIKISYLAHKYLDNLKSIRQRYLLVPHIQSMLIYIEMTGCMLRGEYQKAIEVSLTGASILDNCKGGSHSTRSVLAFARVECCIKLNDFEFGKEQLRLAKPYAKKITVNKIALIIHSILLGVRTHNYYFAYNTLAGVDYKIIRKTLSERHIEEFLLYEACINFLLQAKKINLKPKAPTIRKFRPAAFINRVPLLSQNKSGTNVQILVYQHLFLLIQGKHDELINRQEALKIYARRYLRGPENIRNRSFFKLLGIIVKANFNRLAAMKKAQKTIEVLKKSQGQPNLNDTELVPYEALWEIALEHLEVRKRDERELASLKKKAPNGE